MLENIEKFTSELARALSGGTFVKLTLGNYKGSDRHLQKVNIRLIETKRGVRLFFLYRHDARDIAKNYSIDEGTVLVRKMIGTEFFSGHLFTTTNDLQLTVGRRNARLNIGKPTLKVAPPLLHDRKKENPIDPHSVYLNALGITNASGVVRSQQQHKWRQINKYVEILASLVDKSDLKDHRKLSIVDMGSGKGYLTFAAFDYFRNVRGLDVTMTGVEARSDLAAISNDVARASEFEGLRFVEATIESFELEKTNILIALHACDTATDEAIFKGIAAKADLIVAAPCCHREVRPQITPPEMFRDILKHGVMLERVAETITDGLRSLLLEREGYATKLFEFVSVEHTPKNNMLIGTRGSRPDSGDRFDSEIAQIKSFYGIAEQRLENLLKR
ncbi:MAG: SAM-dependent methyltransferase [Pyrinomonadaceae bacterium]